MSNYFFGSLLLILRIIKIFQATVKNYLSFTKKKKQKKPIGQIKTKYSAFIIFKSKIHIKMVQV